jgi:hypothetical protein
MRYLSAMQYLALTGFLLLASCGGSSEKTDQTATGGSGGTSTGGSGGGTGGSSVGGSGGAGGSGGTSTGGQGGEAGVADSGVACTDGGIDAGAAEEIAASCIVGVIKVIRIDEECSGAGGAHITFDVVKLGRGAGVTRVQYGEHAYWAPPEGPDAVGEFFVAAIDGYGSLMPQEENPGWCLTGLPTVDGRVRALIEASDEADATAKMNALLGL